MRTKHLLLGISFFLLSACTATKESAVLGPSVMYEAQVIQVGGVGSHSITKSAWNGTNTTDTANFDAEKLALVDFNTVGDLMWTHCADGYTITKCESSTGNYVKQDENFGCGLGIEDKLQNTVNIQCIKSE